MRSALFYRGASLCLLLGSWAGVHAIPVFPTAEGFGAETAGGRGGAVLIVSNTNDAGPGSLRAAIDATGPRIVVFRVSGLITLQNPLLIKRPFITIAGQTAPGDGICLKARDVRIENCNDVVIRYIRFRPGDVGGTVIDQNFGDNIWEGDCLSVRGSRNIVIDHCSLSWNVDETVEIYKGDLYPTYVTDNITFQWCIFSEPLRNSVYVENGQHQDHGYGPLMRTNNGHITFHHNIISNCDARNPRVGSKDGDKTFLDFRNNVVYNWGDVCGGGGDKTELVDMNYVGNWVHKGPSTTDSFDTIFETQIGPTKPQFAINHRIYQTDNVMNDTSATWQANFVPENLNVSTSMTVPFTFAPVETDAVLAAKQRVLNGAGASIARDSVDTRIVDQVVNDTGAIIDSQNAVGGWPVYNSTTAPVDSDNDGMPDVWETQYQLNPANAADRNGDTDGDVYTNIEEYINGTNPGVPATRAGRWSIYD
jgi:pectate lyase